MQSEAGLRIGAELAARRGLGRLRRFRGGGSVCDQLTCIARKAIRERSLLVQPGGQARRSPLHNQKDQAAKFNVLGRESPLARRDRARIWEVPAPILSQRQ